MKHHTKDPSLRAHHIAMKEANNHYAKNGDAQAWFLILGKQEQYLKEMVK